MKRLAAAVVGVVAAAVTMATVPHRWCSRGAGELYRGDPDVQAELAASVARWVEHVDDRSFSTGSTRFDGEWVFGTYVTAALGFGQIAREHPGQRDRYLRLMERALDGALSERGRRFDRDAWGSDPLRTLATSEGHAAYLGYVNLALGLHRSLREGSRYAPLNDAITSALARRIKASESFLLETYPGEIYPVDNAAVIASIALFARATGETRAPLIRSWVDRCRRSWIDPRTGLLFQSMAAGTEQPLDGPRGSGSAFAAYFLAYADHELSRELHAAVQRELADDVLGFGAVHEHPEGLRDRGGDIDSGPLIFGYSISATGFAMAGCRIHEDERCFRSLWSTLHLVGAPTVVDGRRTFVSGGPIADSILLAMLTAKRSS